MVPKLCHRHYIICRQPWESRGLFSCFFINLLLEHVYLYYVSLSIYVPTYLPCFIYLSTKTKESSKFIYIYFSSLPTVFFLLYIRYPQSLIKFKELFSISCITVQVYFYLISLFFHFCSNLICPLDLITAGAKEILVNSRYKTTEIADIVSV